jgi:hypothetical protein
VFGGPGKHSVVDELAAVVAVDTFHGEREAGTQFVHGEAHLAVGLIFECFKLCPA